MMVLLRLYTSNPLQEILETTFCGFDVRWQWSDTAGARSYRGLHLTGNLESRTLTRFPTFIAGLPKEIGRTLDPFSLHDNSSDMVLATERILKALSGSPLFEEHVSFVVMALEATMLADDNEGELSFRLAVRTAAIMRLLGEDPVAVAQDIRTAYSARSMYVHGKAWNGKLRNRVNYPSDRGAKFLKRILGLPQPASRQG